MRGVSVAPRELSRLANRPFKTLFPDEVPTFRDVSFAGNRRVSSPAMLVRRLDEMTCVGCHQARSLAGFHLVGEERTGGTRDAMTGGRSEHLREVSRSAISILAEPAAGTFWMSHRPSRSMPTSGATMVPTAPRKARPPRCPIGAARQGSSAERTPSRTTPSGCACPIAEERATRAESVQLEPVRGPDGDTVTSPHAEAKACDVKHVTRRGPAGEIASEVCVSSGTP